MRKNDIKRLTGQRIVELRQSRVPAGQGRRGFVSVDALVLEDGLEIRPIAYETEDQPVGDVVLAAAGRKARSRPVAAADSLLREVIGAAVLGARLRPYPLSLLEAALPALGRSGGASESQQDAASAAYVLCLAEIRRRRQPGGGTNLSLPASPR